MIYDGPFFVMNFLCLDMHMFFFPSLWCYITNDVQFIMHVLYIKKKNEKISEPNKKNVIFCQCS